MGTALVATAILAACRAGTPAVAPPTLLGTAIPTVTAGAAPTVLPCAPPSQLSLPANMPPDVPTPPDFTVWSVQTSPYLKIVGRTTPPGTGSPESAFGIVSNAERTALQTAGWQGFLNAKADGSDWDFTDAQGRKLHMNIIPAQGCGQQVVLTLDLYWITG